jgi:farnesyl-diphosphate farnesyltransferase
LLYLHPLESNLPCVIRSTTTSTDEEKKKIGEDLHFCNEILTRVSRSFAAVIHQLPPNLVVPVMVFYLVLRALDTIEDDMTYVVEATELMAKCPSKYEGAQANKHLDDGSGSAIQFK